MDNLLRCLGISSLLLAGLWAEPVRVSAAESGAACTLYVDSAAGSDGNGSAASPWTSLAGHVDEAGPGDVICLRGDAADPGRVYATGRIEMDQSGTAGAPITLQPHPGEKVILQNTGTSELLSIEGSYWIIDGLSLDQNGGGSRAILIKGTAHHTILRNSFVFSGESDGVVVSQGATHTLIENNHIYSFVQPDTSKDAHCILVQPKADNTTIRLNTIHDCSGDGIQLLETGAATAADFADQVLIEANVLYRGLTARAENALDIKAATNLTVRNNDISGYTGYSCIALQKASEAVVFEGNRVSGCLHGFSLRAEGGGAPDGVTLRNNVIFAIADHGIKIDGVLNGALVHNTISGAGTKAIYIANAGLTGGVIQNNLVVDSGESTRDDGAPYVNVVASHNGWFNSATEFGSPTDVNGGDPGFVNAAGGDYHLLKTSPALDAGLDVGVRTDLDGNPRPFACASDLGAYEHMPSLCLVATPGDGRIALTWTEYADGALDSYSVAYAKSGGASGAAEGASPILGIAPGTLSLSLTGLTNHSVYTITVTAWDSAAGDLAVSNSFRVVPTDVFVFLPGLARPAP